MVLEGNTQKRESNIKVILKVKYIMVLESKYIQTKDIVLVNLINIVWKGLVNFMINKISQNNNK
jgi:hypothetical protein